MSLQPDPVPCAAVLPRKARDGGGIVPAVTSLTAGQKSPCSVVPQVLVSSPRAASSSAWNHPWFKPCTTLAWAVLYTLSSLPMRPPNTLGLRESCSETLAHFGPLTEDQCFLHSGLFIADNKHDSQSVCQRPGVSHS